MTIELRPRIGIAARSGPVRAGLRAMLGEAYEFLEASAPDPSADVDLWLIDGDWEPVPTPFLLLSDSPTRALSNSRGGDTAFGALRRDVEPAALAAAVGSILAGLVVLEPEFRRLDESEPVALRSEDLTAREQEVLQLLALGLANKQISARLGISIHTVKFHTAAILAKLGAASRTEAVTIGAKHGWVVF